MMQWELPFPYHWERLGDGTLKGLCVWEVVHCWQNFFQDREKGRYLQPYLQEVITERKEKEEWNKK